MDSREDICYLYIVDLNLLSSDDNPGHDGYRVVTWFLENMCKNCGNISDNVSAI